MDAKRTKDLQGFQLIGHGPIWKGLFLNTFSLHHSIPDLL